MAADPQLLNSLFNQVLDYAGVGVFAATGAIAAARLDAVLTNPPTASESQEIRR